ncbi:MAG: bluetail domain-containing putative surface protein [Dolichospermum sp.]
MATTRYLGTLISDLTLSDTVPIGDYDFFSFFLPSDLSVSVTVNASVGFLGAALGLDKNLDGRIDGSTIWRSTPGVLSPGISVTNFPAQKGSYVLEVLGTGYLNFNQDTKYTIDISTSLSKLSIIQPSNSIVTEGGVLSFTVRRDGGLNFTHTVNYQVNGVGSNPANFSDIESTEGFITFQPGESSKTIFIKTRDDIQQETNEQFAVQLIYPTNGASITTSTAIATIENNDFIGGFSNDVIQGTQKPDYINGNAGADTLTGLDGKDTFIFQFGQSSALAPDRITDFKIGADKIDLLTKAGLERSAPFIFTRASDSTASTLSIVANNVFVDANGLRLGNQALGTNSAAIVQVSTPGISGTYLIVNDNDSSFSPFDDLMINITGYQGNLPGVGSISVSNFFV